MATNNMADASSGNSELETLSNAAAMMQRESEDVVSQRIEETTVEDATLIEEVPRSEEPRANVEETEEELNLGKEKHSYVPAASEEASQVEVQDITTVLQDESKAIDVGTEEESGEVCITEVRNDQDISIVGLQVDKEDDAIVVMASSHSCVADEIKVKEPDVLGELTDEPFHEEHGEPCTDEERRITEMQTQGTQVFAEVQQDNSSAAESAATTSTAEIPAVSTTETAVSSTATKRSHTTEPEISDSDSLSEAKRKRVAEPEHNYSQASVPATSQQAVPATGQHTVPATSQQAVPVIGQQAVPVAGQQVVPVIGQQAVHVQPLTGTPEEDKTTDEETSQIHVPLTDHSQDPTQLFIPVSEQVQMNTVDLDVPIQAEKEGLMVQGVGTLENATPVVQHVSPPADKPGPVQKESFTEHLFTIEVTTLSTVGGISKPMTVTVLNVASVKFKCSKCSEPFKNQMIGAQLKFYKSHSCKKSAAAKVPIHKAPPTSQQLKQGVSPKNSPVTRSVAKALMGATPPRTPLATPTSVAAPHATRSAVKRGNQSSTLQNSAKVSTPRQTKAKPVAKASPSVKLEKEKKAETGKDKISVKKDDDDDALHPVHMLATRDGQLQFIKEQYNKAKRWNLRKRKRRVVKDEACSENEDDKESNEVESKGVKQEAGEAKDGDEVNDADDANDVDDERLDGDESKDDIQYDDDNADEGSDKEMEDETGEKVKGRKRDDFCIQCYLKLDHKCKIKLMTENRVTSKTCQFCQKTYKTVNSLNQHMRLHTGERPYVCKDCGKSFRRSSTLFEHMRIHGGEKRYLCSVCGRKFLRKSDHTAHLRRHNNDFKYRCNECGKGFKGNAQLEVHMRKHTGEMPFLCTVCGRKFKHPFGLRVHMKYHEMVENPLKCTECDTVYEDPDELRMHECAAGKQHMCAVCGKTFANPFAIKGHMKIHTRPNPSVCKSCHVTFSNEQELQKHQDDNIVKCSVCTKTIKEARSCMLNTLPGNPLKGKKFKCWKCHSAQTGAKAVQTPVAPAQDRASQQVSHSTPPMQTTPKTLMKTVVTSPPQVQPQQIILTTPQRSQPAKPQMILQSSPAASLAMQSPPKVDSSPKISQPMQTFHSGQQVVAIQYSHPVHQAQNVQQMMPQMHQTIQVASGPRHITQQTQLSQAIQSIQPQERDQATLMYQHQPAQTMYSTMTPQQTRSDDTTGHYPTQQIHQMQTYQHHQPQQVQQQHQQQQQHSAQVQTIYQVQHVQQESLLSPQQNVHQI